MVSFPQQKIQIGHEKLFQFVYVGLTSRSLEKMLKIQDRTFAQIHTLTFCNKKCCLNKLYIPKKKITLIKQDRVGVNKNVNFTFTNLQIVY